MKVFVKVKTGARENKVEAVDETHFNISVKSRPIKGEANKEVIKIVAKYLKISQSEIEISSGLTSSQKILKIFR